MTLASDLDLTGRRILVTGAANGFGAAMAESFRAAGAALVLADIEADAAKWIHPATIYAELPGAAARSWRLFRLPVRLIGRNLVRSGHVETLPSLPTHRAG